MYFIYYKANRLRRLVRVFGQSGLELFLSIVLIVLFGLCSISSRYNFFDFFIGGDFFWASFLVYAGMIYSQVVSSQRKDILVILKIVNLAEAALISLIYFVCIKLSLFDTIFIGHPNYDGIFIFIGSLLSYIAAVFTVVINRLSANIN